MNESTKFYKYSDTPRYYGKLKDYQMGPVSSIAEDYFLNRTGKSLIEYQDKLRIATNIREWMRVNHTGIIEPLITLARWEDLGDRFIYFFNDAFSTVHYREIWGDKRGRITLVKNGKERLKHKPYYIDNTNILTDSFNGFDEVIFAEGPFDIINSYIHLFNDRKALFIASGGLANTRSLVMEFTKYHYRARITFVSDDDVDISWYKKYLLKKIDSRISELVVYYNQKAKDVGNISDGFDMKKITLKRFDMDMEKAFIE